MKLKYLLATGCCLLATILVAPALAATSINGEIKLDERVYADGSTNQISWNRAEFKLKIASELSSQAAGYAELKLRTADGPDVSTLADLASKSKVSAYSLELKEAYIDIFGFPLSNLDIRAGKQRIAWGAADKLNPTDNLNPYDFTDFLDFGEKIPTNAMKLTGYFDNTTLTLAALPVFTPAAMPSTFDTSINGYINAYLPAGMTLVSSESQLTLPATTLGNSMYALKLARTIWGQDMSISYFKGFDSVPNMSNLTLTAVSATQMACALTMTYPEIQVLGYDLAGSFNDIGYWLEVASFTPDQADMTVISPAGTTTTEVGQYTKYTLGWDYTFTYDVYVNQQWMHGFFDERGSTLSDFLITRIEKKIMDDDVLLALNWLAEYKNGVVGNMFGPKVSFYPADATEIELGGFNITGAAGSKLSTWENMDQVYLRFKYSF